MSKFRLRTAELTVPILGIHWSKTYSETGISFIIKQIQELF